MSASGVTHLRVAHKLHGTGCNLPTVAEAQKVENWWDVSCMKCKESYPYLKARHGWKFRSEPDDEPAGRAAGGAE